MKTDAVRFFNKGEAVNFRVVVSDELPKGLIAEHTNKSLSITPDIAKDIIVSLQKRIDVFESDYYQWIKRKTKRA